MLNALYDPDPMLHRACCGTVIYDMTRYSCCNPMTSPPKVATVSEGCGFEETSGLSGKELKERDAIRKKLVFPVLKSKEHNWEQIKEAKIKEARLKVEREAREKAEQEAEVAENIRLAEEAEQLRKDKEAEELRRQQAMMRQLKVQEDATVRSKAFLAENFTPKTSKMTKLRQSDQYF